MDSNESENVIIPNICSICRSEPTNAVRLDCGHIFCYLCIKSAAETTGVCALCRRDIPIKFNFKQHEILSPTRVPSAKDGFYWLYEGSRGWWLYDADTAHELEKAHEEGSTTINRLTAGHMYKMNLQSMTQQRESGAGGARKMRRAKLSSVTNVLGMGGLRSDEMNVILDLLKSTEEQSTIY